MRIGIQTWGSHGDIRPLLALAEGLQLSGHEVSLAITCVDSTEYGSSISKAGVKIENVASPVIRDKKKFAKIEKDIVNEKNPITQVQIIIANLFLPVEGEMYQVAENLCANNDLVIGHFFHYPLQTAAEKAGCPYVSVVLVHSAIPSNLQPPAGFPKLGKIGNQLAWWLTRFVLNKKLKIYPDKLRVSQGLKPANDLLTDIWASHELSLISVSPEICQRKNDWPNYYQVCGFLDMPTISVEGYISEDLEEFLSHGNSPVYMTFGSAMPSDVPTQKEVVSVLSEAVKIANCRAIIQAPLWQECGFIQSKTVHYVNAAPYSMVFPRCKAIIHHGGAGTSHSAILAGKPSIVVSHIKEQEFWGHELERIGVSAGLILRRKLTAELLAKRIRSVVGSTKIVGAAERVGAAMNREDGVAEAVRLINERFKV